MGGCSKQVTRTLNIETFYYNVRTLLLLLYVLGTCHRCTYYNSVVLIVSCYAIIRYGCRSSCLLVMPSNNQLGQQGQFPLLE